MRNYIGLDAHSKTCTFVIVDGRGRQTHYQQINTGELEILKFLKSVKGSKALVFEESNLSKWLYTLLKDKVERLVVCDPFVVNRRRGPKDDYPDTLHLAQQLRGDFLTPVFHEDNFFSELRSVVSSYQDLVRDSVRLKNRYKALFRSEAKDTHGKTIYGNENRIKELSKETDQFVAQVMLKQLRLLKEQREIFVNRFKEYEKSHSQIRALSSIPGIGEVRACTIAAIVCSPKRFENKFKFWAYCMLVKHNCMSDNTKYGNKKIPGNRTLKDVFMGAAQSVLNRQAPLCSFYDKQRERGLEHRAAKQNLARKIAAIALSVMRKECHFQENYEVKKVKTTPKKV